jgi:nucleoside-diphosphate-sugar epimerase
VVVHETAHRAVLKSVEEPLATHTANVHAIVAVLDAARRARRDGVVHGLETLVLRYLNSLGPRQRPNSAHAAVVPLFIDALARGGAPTIHGDGGRTRDFTYVSDVVGANLEAMASGGAWR